ncbi:2-hydroxymuconic semialdehyde dehydrogenase [Kordiimonas pumila]|uniref:2-hydroxymuconic semialdehyde dehydrogenase n=1 Tax=Kordiimonas pumila TaxID=2161677 RepID=A0ABV7D6S2_9PROT|nr:2-hydroxymuconic semialdehyde dehydrogenase [Kordiimonas pumila]
MKKQLKNFVAGEFVTTGSTFDIYNPVTGTAHAEAFEADKALVDRAVSAARTALKGEWGSMPLQKRRALLGKVADLIEARFDEFLAAEVADTGKPVSLASHIDIPRGAANFRVFADGIANVSTETFEMDTPDGRGAINYSVRKPLGVIAIISPWNLPLLLMTWKVAPALACGNTIIVKPSEETPSTATLLAEVIKEAGIPDGVFNLVHGFGPDSAGEFLTSHPGVDAITFTGETRTGSAIMRAASETVKALSFEMGGKNPGIVFADADFDAAVEGIGRAIFANTGQVCLATERVYVERPIFDRFVQAMKEKAEAMHIGLPQDAETNFGPLVSAEHRDKVLSYYKLAVEEGATVVTGGGVPKFGDERDNGYYVQPTIITGLPETARCVKEEIFGPIAHIAPFDTEEEAVAMANDTEYGLASSIWTTNLTCAHRVAGQIEAGINWVNCWFLRDLRTPFGGTKMSGIGREGGIHSINFYSEPVNICVKL